MVTNLKTAKALRARRRLRSAPRMVLFLAVHEGASRGARSVAAKLLTKDEARRIAANAAKLPELVLRC